jgi:hypothetical protein
MDKKDALVLGAIFSIAGTVIGITVMLGNGMIGNPFD